MKLRIKLGNPRITFSTTHIINGLKQKKTTLCNNQRLLCIIMYVSIQKQEKIDEIVDIEANGLVFESTGLDKKKDDIKVLYIDIETTGLDKKKDDITVIGTVCVQYCRGSNTATNETSKCFNVCLAVEEGNEAVNFLKSTVYKLMCDCDVIVAFNGINFDIPFLLLWMEKESIHDEIVEKTMDFLNINTSVFSRRVSMKQMCLNNDVIASKYATGKDAIRWAHERNWPELEYYCMQDVHVMRELTEKGINNGLLLIRPTINKSSSYDADHLLEVRIYFSENWAPEIPTQNTTQTMQSVFEIDFKEIFREA